LIYTVFRHLSFLLEGIPKLVYFHSELASNLAAGLQLLYIFISNLLKSKLLYGFLFTKAQQRRYEKKTSPPFDCRVSIHFIYSFLMQTH